MLDQDGRTSSSASATSPHDLSNGDGGDGATPEPPAVGAESTDGRQPRPREKPIKRNDDRLWPRRYAQRLFFSDALIVVAVCLAFGIVLASNGQVVALWPGGPAISYPIFMSAVAVVWLSCLDIFDTRDDRYVGHGVTEYRRAVDASLATFAVIIIAAFFLRSELSRPLFLTVLPAGTVLLVFSRWLWRQWLRRRQAQNRFVHRTIVVGEHDKTAHIVNAINRAHGTGFHLIGAITPDGGTTSTISGIPVLGDFSRLVHVIEQEQIGTLILSGSDQLPPLAMRALGWQLADRDIQLVVAPALTDVAGPRVHSRPVAGLPLIHVTYPTLEGARRVGKRAFDIIGSALLILVFSPVLIGVALAVRFSSPGPILYSQERIGRRGKPFGMLKFRSMVQDADDQLASLLDAQGTSDQPLFKVIDDPRITPVGRTLRKHSLDELPQLFNVLRGRMSLVGPRPQRAPEVALYDDAAHRRLLVKPGMSGLWQVSGRSNLSWEDTLRLDLYYVENWSFTQDIIILFRTIRAVVSPGESAH